MSDDAGSSFAEALRAAELRIANHPGYQEYLEIDALGRTISAVFRPNWRELVDLLDQAATDEFLAMELVQNVRPPVVRDQFHALTSQRLHNYLASTTTLVDHVRRLMGGRTGTTADEFERRKAVLLKHGELPFMANLRNYTLHRALPLLSHSVSVTNVNTPDRKMESEVELGVQTLLEWEGWAVSARAFLQGQGNVLALRPVVQKHGDLVYALNTWLFDQLANANEEALAEVNDLVVARNAILTGGDVEAARRLAERWAPPT